MTRRTRLFIFWALIAAAVLWLAIFLRGGDGPEDLSFDQFEARLDAGDVVTAEILDRSNEVRGELQDGTEYRVTYAGEYADELIEQLSRADPAVEITVDREAQSLWIGVLFSLLPILVLIVVFIFVLNYLQGSGSRASKFGRAKPRKLNKDQPEVTFGDVAGADEAVEELAEIKDFLQEPERFHDIGARIPKGVLLYGPPGTGKTLLARAVAGEAGVPFFSISGSDFVEMFVGVGASRVRDLFEQAKAEAPAIIFVDEIDAVGRHRGAGLGGGHDEREQTLNQLLVEMDGFDVRTGVIMMAATNRPDILDPALLRPGRFDRQITVDRPDLLGRQQILRVHSAGKPLGDEIDLDTVARRTPGFTGADLANLLNEAALLAARAGSREISPEHLGDAIDRVIAGPERRSRVMSSHEKQVIAYHEAGHALVGHVLQNTDPIHKVSIVARGQALGWTLALPTVDKYLKTRSELRDELAMLLGGRTAEEMVFGDPTTGAADDIERVTNLSRVMVTQYGMSEELGPMQFGKAEGEVFLGKDLAHEANYSEEVASAVDAEIARFVDVAHREASEILSMHRGTLDVLANALIEHETLGERQLAEVFDGLETWTGRDAIEGTLVQRFSAPIDATRARELRTQRPTL